MKKINLMLFTAALALGFTAFQVTIAAEAGTEEKTLAWYVANIKEAKKQNQECHNNPSIQSTPNCINSLHALEISFKGGN